MRRHVIPLALAVALCSSALAATGAMAAPPKISHVAFSGVTTDSATLGAEINPEKKPTTYHFEYGPDKCSASPCATIPIPDGKIPAGEAPVPVIAVLEGLTPGSTYHFRVLAKGEGKAESPERTFATYASSVEGLPDDRAYEQASPVNKNGGDATGTFPFVKAAFDGDAVTFLSTSGIPGGKGGQELPLYRAGRGEDEAGWSSQGLLPPASSGQRAQVIGWLPDLSEAYDTATKFGSPAKAALLAVPGDGAPTNITPYVASGSYSFVGASPEGSEVVFESLAKLPTKLPREEEAALEGRSNVYVWDKADEELSLASVLNKEGEAPSKGSFAGPYDWVRGTNATTLSEGGAARDYYTQDEHAVSADGSVYFTAAGSGQLYLRRNPAAPQSAVTLNGDGEEECTETAKACTVQVSASQKTNGKGADGHDAAGTRPAAFMAASADGSKAFFTSSEKLTNDANTGLEPEPPAIARANLADGSSKELSFLPAKASGVAVDGSHVYWADPEDGTIERANLDGTGVDEEFIAPGQIEVETGVNVPSKPRWVAVDAEHIYWSDDTDGEDFHGVIGRATLGAPKGEEVEPEFIKGASNPQGIAVDATHIYWANAGSGSDGTGNLKHGIARAKIDGSEPIQPWSVDSEGHPVGDPADGVALDGTYLYFTPGTGGGGNIERIKLTEPKNSDSILFTGETEKFAGIAVNATHIYWTNTVKKTIGRAELNNPEPNVTNPAPEFIKDAAPSQGLAVDASHIYWSANQGVEPNPGNDLYRYELEAEAGHRLTDLAVDHAHTNGTEVQGVLGASEDGSYVYFVANGVPNGVTNTPNGRGESAEPPGTCQGTLASAPTGTCNLYLWHEGTISFIVRLSISGDGFHTDAANWAATPSGTSVSVNFRKTASVSPDGLTLLFRSQRQLTNYENEGQPELYRYHAGDSGPICVSCNPTGAPPSGEPSLGTLVTSSSVPAPPASVASRNLADSGSRIFFETTDALVASDTNGDKDCPPVGSLLQKFPACQDVYEWEAPGTGSCEEGGRGFSGQDGGCLYLLSTGKGTEPSFFADASASGEDAFLFTRSRLVGQDKDELLDIYDARVDGGLDSQSPLASESCESVETCHEPSVAAPAEELAGSESFTGPENPTPRHKHAKHRQKKKHRHGGAGRRADHR